MITGNTDEQRNCDHTEGDDQRPGDSVNKHPKRRQFMMVMIEHLALIKGSLSQLKDATRCMPPRWHDQRNGWTNMEARCLIGCVFRYELPRPFASRFPSPCPFLYASLPLIGPGEAGTYHAILTGRITLQENLPLKQISPCSTFVRWTEFGT